MGSSERPQAAQPEGPGRARALVLDGSLSPRNGSPNADTSSSDGEVVGSGDARERILDAADDLFAADGFYATPTSRIARRAAVANGLLFYYFPRKMDLLCTLFRERLPVHPLSTVVGIAVEGDVSGSLVRLADRVGLTGRHSQVLSAILFREASTHPLHVLDTGRSGRSARRSRSPATSPRWASDCPRRGLPTSPWSRVPSHRRRDSGLWP